MKYRKIPVVIEAFRLGHDPIPDWFMDRVSANDIIIYKGLEKIDDGCGDWHKEDRITCGIVTLEGVMTGQHGDMIIIGVEGEIYPCKLNIFKKTYEEVAPSGE